MINWDKIDKKVSIKKVILPVFCIILAILFIVYTLIIIKYIGKNIFASKMVQIVEKNENPQFAVEKIYLCSSANAIDKTEEQKLENLDLYQYTDIAIYLKNNKENGLTSQNTIKKLYIDDINVQLDSNMGETSLVYTNLLKIGSKEELKNMIIKSKNVQNEKIDFNIITKNEQNANCDYENPTFYADCSNPISLKYINKIAKNYTVNKNDSAVFDGSILEKAGVKIEEINARIKFRINLINNNDEFYTALVNFKIPLDEIYSGTSIKGSTELGKQYNFFTI